MKINIENLGAIGKANIDLGKKLNIFCGHNSTGKTYMAYLMYFITKYENIMYFIPKYRNRDIDEKNKIEDLINNKKIDTKIDIEYLYNTVKKHIDRKKIDLLKLYSISEEKADEYFRDVIIGLDETEENFKERILNLDIENYNFTFYNNTFRLNKDKGEYSLKIELEGELNNINILEGGHFYSLLYSRIYFILALYPIYDSAIFTVERNSIYTFSKELSISRNEAIEHIQSLSSTEKKEKNIFNIIFGRTTRYPLPITDGLKVANDLTEVTKRKSEYNDFATSIENELLNGKVSINKKDGNVEFKSNRSKGDSLSFHQSSSIVKTLSSLIIYLKHIANKNDLIIIDEPELNLHPENQIKLTRIFAKLINNGLRLIISTHSDYIIREFNNMIMVSSKKEAINKIIKQNGYEEDEYVNKEDVEVNMFNYKNKKEKRLTVEKIPIDDYGFEVSIIDETIEKQNNCANDLYYTLKNNE